MKNDGPLKLSLTPPGNARAALARSCLPALPLHGVQCVAALHRSVLERLHSAAPLSLHLDAVQLGGGRCAKRRTAWRNRSALPCARKVRVFALRYESGWQPGWKKGRPKRRRDARRREARPGRKRIAGQQTHLSNRCSGCPAALAQSIDVPASASAMNDAPTTVLVVEDDPSDARLIEDALASATDLPFGVETVTSLGTRAGSAGPGWHRRRPARSYIA